MNKWVITSIVFFPGRLEMLNHAPTPPLLYLLKPYSILIVWTLNLSTWGQLRSYGSLSNKKQATKSVGHLFFDRKQRSELTGHTYYGSTTLLVSFFSFFIINKHLFIWIKITNEGWWILRKIYKLWSKEKEKPSPKYRKYMSFNYHLGVDQNGPNAMFRPLQS